VAMARRSPSMEGQDLAREVTCATPYQWDEGLWQAPSNSTPVPPVRHRVVAYDFGIKRGILRRLRQSACAVTVVPAATRARDVLDMKPDGIFLSNGPGDPCGCFVRGRGGGRAVPERQAHLRHLPGPPDLGARPGRQDLPS